MTIQVRFYNVVEPTFILTANQCGVQVNGQPCECLHRVGSIVF